MVGKVILTDAFPDGNHMGVGIYQKLDIFRITKHMKSMFVYSDAVFL